MTTSLPTSRAKHIAYGALGAGAASFAFAPAAGATTLTDAAADLVPGDVVDTVAGVAGELPPVPAPLKSLDLYVSQAAGVVPQNLLRTNTGGTADATEVADTSPVTAAASEYLGTKDEVGAYAETVTPEAASAAFNSYVTKATSAPVQSVAADLLAAFDGTKDPNTIGQAFGAFQIPNGDTRAAIADDLNRLAGNVTSGQAVADLRQVIDDTRASQEFAAWRNNTASIFNVDETLPADERASMGAANLIDSVSANPVRGLSELVAAGGGPLAFVVDPAGAITRAANQVFGPLVGEALGEFFNDARNNLARSVFEASPALLLGPLISEIAGDLGTPLGALTGAGIGAILGALAPHNLIPGVLAAIPSAILGGVVTGGLGFIGSLLATLPLLGILPLVGAASGSALALAALATTVFGLYILSFVPATLVALGIGAVAGIGTVVVLVALSGLNPAYYLLALAGGALAFLLITAVSLAVYAALTIAIPMIIFGLLAPLFVLGGATLGALAGLSAAALAASTLIPLVTLLSAIPGALAGGLFGFLTATAISSWISALVGAAIGGVIGALVGNLIGSALGAAIGYPLGAGLFLLIAGLNFGTFLEEQLGDPNGPFARMRDAMNRGWNESRLGHLFGSVRERFFEGTETGRNLGDLLSRVNALFATMTFLDGRRLREMLLRGAVLGGLMGAPVGGFLGGLRGLREGLFNPMNLLNGLMGFIAGAIPGALAGAALGSLLSDLLAPLVGIPAAALSFLPWLGVLFTLWAIPAALTTIAALASTIIPAIAAAIAATLIVGILFSAPLWFPFTVVSTIATLVQAVTFNPATLGALAGLNAIIVPVTFLAVGAAAIILVTSLLLAAVFVGIPTFAIVAALFTFPALLVPLAWTLALPLLLPLAAGLSLLTGLAVGSAADLLSKFVTIPLGALIGGLIKGTLSGLTALTIATAVRTTVYTLAGAGLGTIAGAVLGSVLGTVAALLTHLRVGVGMDDGAVWADGRIVNARGFGDIVGRFIPAFNGLPKTATERVAVPQAAAPRLTASSPKSTRDRSLTDASAMVGV